MKLPSLLLLITLAGCHASPPPAAPIVTRVNNPALTVMTDCGPIVGALAGGTRRFLGIPYAAPPVGARRFQPPAPAAAWTQPRDATRFGHSCVQLAGARRDPDSDEDCLTLNVWTPRGGDNMLPVMVWIHGGAFIMGSGSEDQYDGARLAEREHAVVVTLNYRLGALGFLALPELARELGRTASPAIALLDQRAALQWVRRNSGAFGGDAGKVTIFGESAGAWSTCAQLASPGSRGLFARAIMESGACSDALYFTPETAEAQGLALANKLGCDGATRLQCLRALPAEAIIAALPPKRGLILPPGVWWGPIVDGVELPQLPLAMIRAGDFARVPLMIGANRDEGVLHTVSFPTVTPAEVEAFVRDAFGAAAARVVPAHYPRATPKETLDDVITDGVFVCGARRVARAFAERGVPAFVYHFAHPLDDPRVHDLGATHSVELFFVWGNTSQGFGLAPDELPLSRAIMDAWGAFARSGDPSTPSLPWPRYTLEGDAHLTLDLHSTPGAHLKREACDFWDELEPR